MVSKASLLTDAYNAVYSLVTSNISDTQSPVRNTSQWCYSAYPTNKGANESDYPIVVINPAEFNTENVTFTKTKANITLTIDVYMSGNTSMKYADQVLDDIQNIILSNKHTSLRNTYGLGSTEIADMDTDTDFHGSMKVHRRSLTISCNYKFSD